MAELILTEEEKKVQKLGPIITKDIVPFHIDSTNINGPCVFKKPDFLPWPGSYIMLFAHHHGDSIRVAYSDSPERGWKVWDQTILHINDTPGYDHIASPDVRVEKDRLVVCFHSPYKDGQYSFAAHTDGVSWHIFNDDPLPEFYYRQFTHNSGFYAITKDKNIGGSLWKWRRTAPIEPAIEKIQSIIPNMRHGCYDDGYWYFTKIGDAPESILRCKFGDWDNHEIVLEPSKEFEFGGVIGPSKPGAATNVTQVRDPYILNEGGSKYLYYTFRGEEGIAVAKLNA